jgi:hypothetical protein
MRGLDPRIHLLTKQIVAKTQSFIANGSTRGSSPIGAKMRCDVSRMRCSASDSEAVHCWSGTVAKEVCVTVPGLQRIIPLRSMLRSARDTRLS